MIPQQTIQVLSGSGVAFLYAGSAVGIGMSVLQMILPNSIKTSLHSKVGASGHLWLSFIFGQGVMGTVWLLVAMSGQLYPWLVWVVLAAGWFLALPTIIRRLSILFSDVPVAWQRLKSFIPTHFWYSCMALVLAVIIFLKGFIALLPTAIDDALWVYMTVAKVVGESHALQFVAFATPHNALYPLQIEMHWAALFAISNETAVTLWDYFCALSFLSGVGYLSWCVTSSGRAALLAVAIVLSTPGFYYLMGGGKTDNGAAQYGIAAFLLIAVSSPRDLRPCFLAGLCAGWAIASRYTNIILLPALIVFTLGYGRRYVSMRSIWNDMLQERSFWVKSVTLGGIGVVLSSFLMLVKNWLLVDCPLAPFFGCEETFWAHWAHSASRTQHENLSLLDLFFYPFVCTFAHRADMAGNISPLFLGLLPLMLRYRQAPVITGSVLTGLAGLVSLVMWLSMYPFILFTRFLLVPLGLLAVPFGASIIAAEADLTKTKSTRRLFGIAILILFTFLLFQSRGVVNAIRYVSSIDTRAQHLERFPGYAAAAWINFHAKPGQRIALAYWGGYPYFLDSPHLLNSETQAERQWLWEHLQKSGSAFWTEEIWRFYATRRFTYVLLAKKRVDEVLSVWPGKELKRAPLVAFEGRDFAILEIDHGSSVKHEIAER